MLAYFGYDMDGNPWYDPLPDDFSPPPGFDPSYATTWFGNYAGKKNIIVYNLGRDITAYVRKKGMKKPYLSFTCDRHLNAEGQALMARMLVDKLLQHRLIPADE